MSSPIVLGSIKTPGSAGLLTEDPARAEDPTIATELRNVVYDSRGRICARKGWENITLVGDHGQVIDSIFEYVVSNSSKIVVHAANNKIYSGTSTLADITSTTAPTADDWVFVNFNGKCIGTQVGHTAIAYTGAGVFTDIVPTGTLPTGGIALSAWGRLWVTDANDTAVKYCALLDETGWGAGAGVLDLTEVWPDGMDRVTGLAELQDKLVIFGERSTLIYINPHDPNATMGSDATTNVSSESLFQLDDVIRVGCIAHRSIQLVANDLIFLSIDGLHSLRRAIEYKNIPQEPLAQGIRTELIADIQQSIDNIDRIHCVYSKVHGFYLAKIGTKTYWSFDLKQGTARPSKWVGPTFTSCCETTDGRILYGQVGVVGLYDTYKDDTASYEFRYKSAYLDLAQGRTVFPKTMMLSVVTRGAYSMSLYMAYDYRLAEQITQVQLPGAGAASEWQPPNVATTPAHEWGTGEWSGGSADVIRAPTDLLGAGTRVQIGLRVKISAFSFCLQRIDMTSRLGRLAA